jgi:hypothetical protein
LPSKARRDISADIPQLRWDTQRLGSQLGSNGPGETKNPHGPKGEKYAGHNAVPILDAPAKGDEGIDQQRQEVRRKAHDLHGFCCSFEASPTPAMKRGC